MTIPFSQVKPASLKMRVLPRYPAAYRAGPGIAIEQASGVVTTSVDFANLTRDDITDPTTLYVAGWDNANHLFKLVLGSNLKGVKGDQGTPGPANASDYETRALAAAATIAAPIQYLRTAGYAAAGDGGGALYKRSVGPAAPDKFQSADGAYWQLAEPVLRPQMFGAKGDGIADDTTAIQAAVTAAQGTIVNIFFPAGTYKVSSTINITNSVKLFGLSRASVNITWTSTALTVFSVFTDSQVTFEGLSLTGPVGATGGAVVSLTGNATQNFWSTFRDCAFLRGFYHILTTSACNWTIDNCSFGEYVGFGVFVSDTFNPDAGDSVITNSFFASGIATSVAIFQQSSGGLKLLGNKILGGKYGYQLSVAPTGPATIDLVIVGNSIENQTNAGIWFERLSGAVTFGNVVIVGNQLSNMPTGIGTDANAGWLSRMTITANQITLATGAGTCISLGSPSSFLVDGNEFFGQTGSPLIGVAVGAGATGGQIGVNAYNNLTIPVSNASAAVVVTQRTQKGSGSCTTSTAVGSLFNGTIAVTYPFIFGATPKVMVNVTSTGVSAWATGITTTGFTVTVWAAANSAGVLFDWVAFADA